MAKLNFAPLQFWITNAWRNIRQGLLINLASTASIATALLLVGLAGLGLVNLDRLTSRWGRGLQIIVYLKPDVPPARVESLHRLLKGRPEVSAVQLITPRQAHRRLRSSLGKNAEVLDSVEPEFLPTSLEIALLRDHPGQARTLVALLRSSSLVEEVDYMGDWARRLDSLVLLLRGVGLGLALIVSLACLYIVGSTIRLGVYARREEIEIMRLVGATHRFVRAPFMIEGALQGLTGAAAACGVLYIIYSWGAPRLERSLSAIFTHMQVSFLPPLVVLLGLLGGTLLGLVGSRLALSRYVEG
jgi:cell division transport system permease protein